MKTTQRLLLTVIMTTLGIYSFAQNVLPASGNVGIGTATPSTELQVEGTSTLSKTHVRDTAIFDKPVIIKDSVTLERKLTVDQDLRIKGKTVVDDNFRAKSNVVVLGTTRMKGNAIAEGNFRFLGLADSTLTDERFLMIKPNGKVENMEKGGLVDLIELEAYGKECKFGSGQEITSYWKSTPNQPYGILSTGSDCPARVGIGIGIPTATLDVRGNTYLSGNTGIGIAPNNQSRLHVNQQNPTRDALTVELTSNSANTTGIGINTVVNKNDRKALNVHNAESETDVFSVFGDGRIVMENNNPLTKVISIKNSQSEDVFRVMGNGNVWATEVRVRLKQDFPDYVFSEEYDLISIEDLEKFIETNSHLPNLPSATEVTESGLDLGEMNRLLVEKVEELTLYTIQQQKMIVELLNKVNDIEVSVSNK